MLHAALAITGGLGVLGICGVSWKRRQSILAKKRQAKRFSRFRNIDQPAGYYCIKWCKLSSPNVIPLVIYGRDIDGKPHTYNFQAVALKHVSRGFSDWVKRRVGLHTSYDEEELASPIYINPTRKRFLHHWNGERNILLGPGFTLPYESIIGPGLLSVLDHSDYRVYGMWDPVTKTMSVDPTGYYPCEVENVWGERCVHKD